MEVKSILLITYANKKKFMTMWVFYVCFIYSVSFTYSYFHVLSSILFMFIQSHSFMFIVKLGF